MKYIFYVEQLTQYNEVLKKLVIKKEHKINKESRVHVLESLFSLRILSFKLEKNYVLEIS